MKLNERIVPKSQLDFAFKTASIKSKTMHLAMCDGNGFKKINDTFGHLTGDKVIKRMSDILVSSLRKSDVVVRFGGDEFLLMLLDVEDNVAKSQIKRVQEAIRRDKELLCLTCGIGVSLSIGLCKKTESHKTLESIIHDADKYLYAAKKKKPYFRVFWDETLPPNEEKLSEIVKRKNKLHRAYFDFLVEACLDQNPSYHTELLKASIRHIFRSQGRAVSERIVLKDMICAIKWQYEKDFARFKDLVDQCILQGNTDSIKEKLEELFGQEFDYKNVA